MSLRIFPVLWIALVILACGEQKQTSEFPSRDWSGMYLTQVVDSSTDCWDATKPPHMPGFTLEVTHLGSNDVVVKVTELIRLAGFFHGDQLDAKTMIAQQLSLPDSLLALVAPEDSLDMISYTLTADFEGRGFGGEYVVRSADVRGLAMEQTAERCEYRYTFKGEEPISGQEPATGLSSLRSDQ